SSRQLGRLMQEELGVGPLALARTERVRTARTLIEATTMPVSDIAFAAGFASIRQFNDTFRDMYSLSPRQLRTAGSGAEVTDELVLRLAYRRPLDLEYLLDYLRVRAVAGIETVENGAYTRSMRLAHGPAAVTPGPSPAPAGSRCRPRGGRGHAGRSWSGRSRRLPPRNPFARTQRSRRIGAAHGARTADLLGRGVHTSRTPRRRGRAVAAWPAAGCGGRQTVPHRRGDRSPRTGGLGAARLPGPYDPSAVGIAGRRKPRPRRRQRSGGGEPPTPRPAGD